jgi:hypothetical protein
MKIITKPARRTKRSALLHAVCESGPQLMKWRRSFGIARPLFAEVAHFSERKLATYEKAAALPENVVRPVRESVRLLAALSDLCGDPAQLSEWLVQPNKAFAGRSPLDLIRSGEASQLWEMIHQVRQGAFA